MIPQARQGGSGVYAVAVVGSKLDGTGFGKLHIEQIHVAVLGWGLLGAGDRIKESAFWNEEEEEEDMAAAATALDCSDARFAGLGMSVTLADDFRKPA